MKLKSIVASLSAFALFTTLAPATTVLLSDFESLYQLAQIDAIATSEDATVIKVTGERQPTVHDVSLNDYLVVQPTQVRDLERGDLVLIAHPGVDHPVLRRVVRAGLRTATTKADTTRWTDRFPTTDETLYGVVTARIANDLGVEKLVDSLPVYTEEELAALEAEEEDVLTSVGRY